MTPSIKALGIAFAVLFVGFSVLSLHTGRRKHQPLLRPGFWTDVGWWFTTPFMHKLGQVLALLVVVPVALVVWGKVDPALVMHGFGPLARLPLWLQAVLIVVIGDFAGYWMHRKFHRGRLWRFHAVHHSSTQVDWLSAVRVHPVNETVMRLAGAASVLPLGLAPAAFATVAPALTLFAILLHADVDWDWGPLRSVIASPRFHRWHHTDEAAARDRNFAGLLPVWDIVFGTYHMPYGERPRSFGTDTPMAPGLWGQLAAPLKRAVR